MAAPARACRICGSAGEHRAFMAAEMMFGSRETFEYLECERCGCLQIGDIPPDLARYYPEGYCSFSPPGDDPPLRRYLKRKRTRNALGETSVAGMLLLAVFGPPAFFTWVREAGAGFGDPILDVGSGSGHLLRQMRDAGFTRLTGIDPFLDDDVDLGGGLVLLRRSLEEMEGEFRLVMLHHSFEHMPDPHAALRDVRRLLSPSGVAVIRMPVAGSFAWRTYGTDWVQLDAPRHLHLHTPESVRVLARAAGLDLKRVEFDSTGFQFWGSEQYRRGIPLTDPRSHGFGGRGTVFSRKELASFERKAHALNRSGAGDAACFYLESGPMRRDVEEREKPAGRHQELQQREGIIRDHHDREHASASTATLGLAGTP